MQPRRIARLESLIRQRAAEVIDRDLADPRRGLITVTRAELDKEVTVCKIFWSVLGTDADRRTSARFLESARGYVQREVGKVLSTRTIPRLTFHFDERIEGSARIDQILHELRGERGETEEGPAADAGDEAPDSGAAPTDLARDDAGEQTGDDPGAGPRPATE